MCNLVTNMRSFTQHNALLRTQPSVAMNVEMLLRGIETEQQYWKHFALVVENNHLLTKIYLPRAYVH